MVKQFKRRVGIALIIAVMLNLFMHNWVDINIAYAEETGDIRETESIEDTEDIEEITTEDSDDTGNIEEITTEDGDDTGDTEDIEEITSEDDDNTGNIEEIEEMEPLDERERRSAFLALTTPTLKAAPASPSSITATDEITVAYGDLGLEPSGYCRQLTAKTSSGETTYLVCVETNVSGMYQTGLSTYNDIRTASSDLLRKALYYGHTVGNQTTKQQYYGISNSTDGIVVGSKYPINTVNGVRDIAMEVQGINWKDSRTSRNDLKAYLITHHAASKIFIEASLAKDDATWTWNMNDELRSATLEFIEKIKTLPSPPETFKVYLAYPPSGQWSQAYAFPLMEPIMGKAEITKTVTGNDAASIAAGTYKFKLTDKNDSSNSVTLEVVIVNGQVQGNASIDLLAGTYSVVETEAPNNVGIAGSIPDITVTAGSTASITVEDTVSDGDLEITKQVTGDTEDNNGIYGDYVFELTDINDSNNKVTVTVTLSKSNGTSVTKKFGLKAGTYSVKEVRCPEACELNTDIPNVTVKPGETSKISVTDIATERPPETGGFRLKKYASSYPLGEDPDEYDYAGGVFGIYRTKSDAENDVNRLKTLTTNSKGYTEYITGLLEGDYYVRELEAPPGFLINNQIITVHLGEGITGTAEIGDERKSVSFASIRIIKTIDPDYFDEFEKAVKENPDDYSLLDAEYTIYADEACTEELKVLTTVQTYGARNAVRYNSDGSVARTGEYYEVMWPISKYYANNPQDWSFTSEWDTKNRVGTSYPLNRRFSISDSWKPSIGTYYVKETKASKGFSLDPTVYKVEIYDNGEGGTSARTDNSNRQSWNPFIPLGMPFSNGCLWSVERPESNGMLTLTKGSSNTEISNDNGLYDMTGIKYNIYKKNAGTETSPNLSEKVAEMEIMSYDKGKSVGQTTELELPSGEYWIQEDEQSVLGSGYAWNKTAKKAVIESGNTTKVEFTGNSGDAPQSEQIKTLLSKYDARLNSDSKSTSSNAPSLAGAEFEVKYYDGIFDGAEKAEASGNPKRSWIFRTDKDGIIDFSSADKYLVSGDKLYKSSDGKFVMPIGSIVIKETKAPTGFVINDEKFFGKIEAGNNTSEFVTSYATKKIAEKPIAGGLSIVKKDAETENGTSQGDADFSGIEFSITSKCDKTVVVEGKEYKPGEIVKVITTDEKGTAKTAVDLLPYGKYEVKETKSNGKYLLSDNKSRTIEIKEDGKILEIEPFSDNVIRGGVKIKKIDSETEDGGSQGWGEIEGAEITIYNASPNPVLVNDKLIPKDSPVMVLVTDGNGNVELAKDVLPYGTYIAKETKASKGYEINENWEYRFHIREDGIIIEEPDNILKEDVLRLDLSFKKTDMNGNAMSNIPFLISRLDEKGKIVEQHVIVSDGDGIVNTAGRSKDPSTVNSLDSYVRGGVFTDESKLDSNINVWFGIDDKEDAVTKTNPDRGSLLYAQYKIEELRVEANRGMDLLKTYLIADENNRMVKDVEIMDNAFNEKTRDLSNVFVNLIIHPASELLDIASNSKLLTIGKSVAVKDTFSYDHLKVDQNYILRTELYYIDRDGKTRRIAVSESGVWNPEKAYSGRTSRGEIISTFNIDTSEFIGGTINALSILYSEINDEFVELTRHNSNLDIESQRVYIPWMITKAHDGKTGDHVGTAFDATTEIVDVISYENLHDGTGYLFKGGLKDAETGEEILGTNGKPASSEAILKGNHSYDGEIEMPGIEVDLSKYEGKTIVVTETLINNDTGEVILTHDELLDEDQSVYIPRVSTTATDQSTSTHTGRNGETKVIDRVTIDNTIPGLEYEVKGTLVYQSDGILADGTPVKAGDVIAISEGIAFTADSNTSKVELLFDVDSSKLEGLSGVVFEDLYHNNIIVAVHRDIDDESQTVNFPIVRTKAMDSGTKSNVGIAGGPGTILDKVNADNLTIGDTYLIKGELMNPDGTAFLSQGEPVIVESEPFEAVSKHMSRILEFNFDASELEGKSLVVFEKLYLIKTANHEDNNEEENNEEDNNEPIEVAKHEDLNDDDQRIDYPTGKTEAKDVVTETHTAEESEKTEIVDTVYYENLVEKEEYVITGTLMDKNTGKEIKVGGEPVTSTVTFVPETKNGEVKVPFTFDSTELKDSSIVVFERVRHNDIEVFTHEDINSEEQTIQIVKKDVPVVPTVPEVPGKTEKDNPPATKVPGTGDREEFLISLMLFMVAVMGILIVVRENVKDDIKS